MKQWVQFSDPRVNVYTKPENSELRTHLFIPSSAMQINKILRLCNDSKQWRKGGERLEGRQMYTQATPRRCADVCEEPGLTVSRKSPAVPSAFPSSWGKNPDSSALSTASFSFSSNPEVYTLSWLGIFHVPVEEEGTTSKNQSSVDKTVSNYRKQPSSPSLPWRRY